MDSGLWTLFHGGNPLVIRVVRVEVIRPPNFLFFTEVWVSSHFAVFLRRLRFFCLANHAAGENALVAVHAVDAVPGQLVGQRFDLGG